MISAGILCYDTIYTPPTTNLKAHWDASIASSIHIATGATGVNQWDDLTGNGCHLLQATGVKQPTYSGSGTSSVMTFTRFTGGVSGTECWMSAAFTQAQPVTIYAVIRQNNWSINDGIWDGITNNSMLMRQRPSGSSIGMYALGGGFLDQTNAVLTYSVVTAVYDATSACLINDANGVSSTSPGVASPNGFILGGSSGGALPSGISIKEIYYYSANHNSTTQTSIVNYLRNKWGV